MLDIIKMQQTLSIRLQTLSIFFSLTCHSGQCIFPGCETWENPPNWEDFPSATKMNFAIRFVWKRSR